MPKADVLRIELDNTSKVALSEQIYRGIAQAIEQEVLTTGARLPSWIDLAAQLGVARGTVRVAYEKLTAAQLVVASRSTGTRVAPRPAAVRRQDDGGDAGPFMEQYQEMTAGPAIFQMGIPSRASLPAKLLNRVRTRAVLAETSGAPLYPDPRGEMELRREIAGYLAVARGLACSASQIFITGGYNAGLGLALHVLGLEGRQAWMEDPGFPFTRHALRLARLTLASIPVDEEGLDVHLRRPFHGERPYGPGSFPHLAIRRDRQEDLPSSAAASRVSDAGMSDAVCARKPRAVDAVAGRSSQIRQSAMRHRIS